jgi:hypothetical protein
MTKRELILAVAAVSLSAACKSTNGISYNDSKPTFSYPQGNLSCGDAGADPNNPNGTLVTCTLDFGGVPIGQTATATISMNNDSATQYQILSQTQPTDPQFTVQQLQLPVTVIQSVPLSVSFKPFSQNQLSDSFTLTTDSQSAQKIVFNLTGSGINIAVALSSTNLDFGKVIVHSTEEKSIVVTNESTGDITLSPLVPAGNSANLFSVAFANAPGDFTQNYSYATPIPPMGKVTFQVTFAPTTPSYADETAYVTITYANDKYVNVGLKGFGVKTGLAVTTTPPSAQLTPRIDYGHIPLNNSVTDYIYVQNISNQVIKLYHSYLDNSDGDVFTVAQPGSAGCPSTVGGDGGGVPMNCQQVLPGNNTYTLNPGDLLTYPITFAPRQGQGYVGEFSVQDDHADNVKVPITGGGGGPAISCQTLPASPPPLALNFGEVAVNIGAVLQLVCTNTGNDITLAGKIDPSAELVVYESGLVITQAGASYTAQLVQSGLPTPQVSLRSGEQFVVQVTYDPEVATPANMPETGTLHINSNAVLTPSVPVALSGSGLVLTDCNLTISPNTLNFDQITPGQTVSLPVTLVNSGNNACLINGLSLSPDTDPAYTISTVTDPATGSLGTPGLVPPSSVKLCGVNEPADGCMSTTSYGTQYQVLVQFKPPTPGTYQGLLDFVVSSKSAPAQDVPISGSAGTGCLIISPQELDFGNVGIKQGTQYCKTSSRHIRALNTCNTPVIVTGLTNSTQSGDFRISSSPQIPYNLQVGSTFDFEEQFEPATAGAKYGSATIVAGPSLGAPQSYLAAFHGTASDSRQQTDTYVIPPQKVDILWVIGWGYAYSTLSALGVYPYNTGTYQKGIVASLQSYIDGLGSADYHIGIVSSIDCVSRYQYSTPYNDFIGAGTGPTDTGDLQILPCSGCTDNSGNDAQIITPADQDPAGEMSTIINNMANSYLNGNAYWESYGCPVNQGYESLGFDALQPAFDVLTASAQAGHNKGFYRDDAALVIVNVSVADDGSSYLTGQPLNFYYTYFENLKGFNPLTPFIYNTIGMTTAEFNAQQYYCPNSYDIFIYGAECPQCGIPFTNNQIPPIVAETGGQVVDICTTSWGPALTNLGQISSAVLTSFGLSGSPVNPPDGISVAISGAPIPQYTVDGGAPVWTYDPLTGTLTFPNPSNAPGSGDTLTITYTNVCY